VRVERLGVIGEVRARLARGSTRRRTARHDSNHMGAAGYPLAKKKLDNAVHKEIFYTS